MFFLTHCCVLIAVFIVVCLPAEGLHANELLANSGPCQINNKRKKKKKDKKAHGAFQQSSQRLLRSWPPAEGSRGE